jgi:hypothetical protein
MFGAKHEPFSVGEEHRMLRKTLGPRKNKIPKG